jgi:hypothetical protein
MRRYGGATPGRDSFCARRRRKSAVGAEESLQARSNKSNGPSKKASQQERKRLRSWQRKRLRSWQRLENEETGFQVEQRNQTRSRIAVTSTKRPRGVFRFPPDLRNQSGQMMCYQNRTTPKATDSGLFGALLGEPDRTARLFIGINTGLVHEPASEDISETQKLKSAIEQAIANR